MSGPAAATVGNAAALLLRWVPAPRPANATIIPALQAVDQLTTGRRDTLTRLRPVVSAAPGPGGGIAERPSISLTPSKVGDKQKSSPYRVLLHNDDVNKREYVVSVLMKVVDGLTIDDAVNVMAEAHQNGKACVCVCGQPDAERYCEGLRGNGLIASIEPAGGGGKGGGPEAG